MLVSTELSQEEFDRVAAVQAQMGAQDVGVVIKAALAAFQPPPAPPAPHDSAQAQPGSGEVEPAQPAGAASPIIPARVEGMPPTIQPTANPPQPTAAGAGAASETEQLQTAHAEAESQVAEQVRAQTAQS